LKPVVKRFERGARWVVTKYYIETSLVEGLSISVSNYFEKEAADLGHCATEENIEGSFHTFRKKFVHLKNM